MTTVDGDNEDKGRLREGEEEFASVEVDGLFVCWSVWGKRKVRWYWILLGSGSG